MVKWLVLGIGVIYLGCGTVEDEQRVEATPSLADTTARYVRREERAVATPLDTGSTLAFTDTDFRFGRVRAGTTVRHHFTFTNEGPAQLRIGAVASSCGCTVSRYPTEAIDSGASGSVEVTFRTSATLGHQHRAVVLHANTTPPQTTLYLSGEVVP
ncbi:DUF1573 domain-containing protein [Neolewinella sp.]|uniref:DUF1573 domain-containing protein n=1 Tax=Neolewinella sp. TaxID=2993543 RepID=UPI003B5207D1